MKLFNDKLEKAFKSKSALKVIAGIENTNISQIVKIVEAAKLADATYLDISANTKLVRLLKSLSDLPICVSSIDPIDLYNCVVSGADIVEIGNYDFFYQKGIYITVDELVYLFKEVKSLIPDTDICVTIPYYLDCEEQIQLTKKLDFLGVNIIQTEGMSNIRYVKSNLGICSKSLLYSLNSFVPSLLSTYIISNITEVPVLSSSGFKNINSSISKFYGASGVGISSSFQKQKTVNYMTQYIAQTVEALRSSSKTTMIDTQDNNNFLNEHYELLNLLINR